MMAQWDVTDNAVWFEIVQSEKKVTFRIDGDTLWKYFDAESSAEIFAMRMFILQRPTIEALAAAKFQRGEYAAPMAGRGPVVWLRANDVVVDQ